MERDLAGLELLQADRRLDHDLDQCLGLLGGDLFDIHAAALGGDDAHALGLPVEDVAEIEFALERVGGLDVDALDRLALGTGLERHETLAQQIAGGVAHLVVGAAELDPAGLAPRTGMDLRLHGPERSAEFGRGVDRLIRAEGHGALRHGDPEAREQLLGLVLVNVHRDLLRVSVVLVGPTFAEKLLFGKRVSSQFFLVFGFSLLARQRLSGLLN